MMISDNIEALTSFDGPRDDFDDGTCGVLIRSTDTGVYKAICGIAKDDIDTFVEAYNAQKIHWCCDSCPNSSYCN